MSGSGHLALRPELCDGCGRCVPACSGRHLRVGSGFIHVDAAECEGCFACVEACEQGAIIRRVIRARESSSGPALTQADLGKVVVGSRAEAKALRKAAAARTRAKPANAKPATARGGTSAGIVSKSRPVETGGAQWGALEAVAVGASLLMALAAKGAVLGSRAVELMPPGGQVVTRTSVLGIFWLMQVAVLAFLAHRRGMTLPAAFRLKPVGQDLPGALRDAGMIAAMLVGTLLASAAWGAVTRAIGWFPPQSESLQSVFGAGGVGLALAVGMVVVVAPLAEELVFRGVMATALLRRFGVLAAVLGSSAVFALYHVTPWVFVPRFVLGCALAWLALTRRTLWPAVLLHALHNGVVVGAAFWLPGS